MTHQPELRVSDTERQAAADRLRAAHDEGRLDLREYDERLVQAYASVTYADLERLFADLPQTPRIPAGAGGAPALPELRRPVGRRGAFGSQPLRLRTLWITWVLAVGWSMISGSLAPLWLAVSGVVLLGASGTVVAVRAFRAPVQG